VKGTEGQDLGASSHPDLVAELHYRYQTLDPSRADDRARREALMWCRATYPRLRELMRQQAAVAAGGSAPAVDQSVVELAQMLVRFLVAIADWTALAETSALGIDSAGRLADDQAREDLMVALGVGLQGQQRDAAAETVFQQVLGIATALGHQGTRGAAFAHLGQLRLRKGEPDQAVSLFQQAALAYQVDGHRAGQARTLGDLAPLLYQLGNVDEAIRYAQRAGELFREIGDLAGQAAALRLVAAGHAARGGSGRDQAISALAEAAEQFETVGAIGAAVEAMHTAAQIHQEHGAYQAALSSLRKAIDLARDVGEPAAADLVELEEVLVVQAAVETLLEARTGRRRDAVIATHPVLLGGLALMLLINIREEAGSADDASAISAERALDTLSRRQDGALAQWVAAEMATVRRLAAAEADHLPVELPDLVRRLALVNHPAKRMHWLAAVLRALPIDRFPAPHGFFLLQVAQANADAGRPENALEQAQRATSLLDRLEGRPEWAAAQVFVGTTWREREFGEPSANIDHALAAFRRALTVYRRASHPEEWAGTLVNLANAYWKRSGPRDLRRALHRHAAALTIFTRDAYPTRWARVQNNLALVESDLAVSGDPSGFEPALRRLQEALTVPGVEPVVRGAMLLNLSRRYLARVQGDQEDNHESALRCAREAFDISASQHRSPDTAEAATAVGAALGTRGIRNNGADDVRAAIEWFERALRLVPVTQAPLRHAAAADNLANALVQQADPSQADLRRAVELHELALRLYRDQGDRVEEARACYNLAATLVRGNNPDPSRAISLLERSLQVRSRDTRPVEWVESMTELARVWLNRSDGSADPARATRLLHDVVGVTAAETAPEHAIRAWGLLGAAYSDQDLWADADRAYDNALLAAERRYAAAMLPSGRETELIRIADLPRSAAYAAARAGRARRAAVILEAARARALGHRLQRDRADLTTLDATSPAAAAAFRTAIERIRTVEAHQRIATQRRPDDERVLRATMTDAQAQLRAAVETIRALPGLGQFLRDAPGDAVTEAVGAGTSLAYIATTEHGSATILVSSDGRTAEVTHDLIFSPLAEPELIEALAGLESLDDDEGLTGVLDVLGDKLIEPLAQRLNDLGLTSVTLVATGLLGALPLHAARYSGPGRRRCLFDEVDVAYTPSARVLLATGPIAGTVTEAEPRLVGVADPTLPEAQAELAAVCEMFGAATDVLPSATATTDALLRALPGATHLHLACHGLYEPADPMTSYLALAQGDRLTLRQLLDSRALAGIRLVVASACHSAATDVARLSDEVIGLPAGLVEAGATSVIGTLWEVNDRSAALLVARFYANYLRGDPESSLPPMPPAQALARAQRWLANATKHEIDQFATAVGLRRRHTPSALPSRTPVPGPPSAVPRGRQHRPYAGRPSQWAPFVLVGRS